MNIQSLKKVLQKNLLLYISSVIIIFISLLVVVTIFQNRKSYDSEAEAVVELIERQSLNLFVSFEKEMEAIQSYCMNDQMDVFYNAYETDYYEYDFERVEMLDQDGHVIKTIPENTSREGFDLSKSDGFISAQEAGTGFHVGSISFDSTLGKTTLVNTLGNERGYIVAYYNLDSLGNILKNINLDNGYIAIIDDSGKYLAHTFKEYVEERRINIHFNDFGESIQSGDQLTYLGNKHFIRYKTIEDLNITILYYQSSERYYNSIILILLIGLLAISAIILSVRFVISKTLVRLNEAFDQLTSATESIASGIYDYDVDHAFYNEILPLVDSFKHMSEEIETRETKIISLINEREENFYMTISLMAKAIEAKDLYTGNHCERVREFSVAIGKEIGLDSKELSDLMYGSILHDIGKIGIDESVLNKPGRLTPEEYKLICTHPQIGSDILSEVPMLKYANDIILYHHEAQDGSGYPKGLKGDDIPLMARIVSIADAFDAMTSKRPYREDVMSEKEAFEELERCSGSQFDEVLVQAFKRSLSL